MKILDVVLRQVEGEIAAHPVERGGALLGPRSSNVVSEFLYDPDAETTGASYSPSRRLNQRVREIEQREGLELKGIVHSHPGSFDEPSHQDVEELGVLLERNPHMVACLAPIVTHRGEDRDGARNVTVLPSGRATWYVARRSASGRPSVRECPVTVVPFQRDLEAAAGFLGGEEPTLVSAQVGESFAPAGAIRLPGGAELLVMAAGEYPVQRPLLVISYPDTAPESVETPWPLEVPDRHRLVAALKSAFCPPGPYRALFGPANGPALTADASVARAAGWHRVHGASHEDSRASAQDGLFARSAGLLSRSLVDRTVLVVGTGSVGSYMAAQLARSGVGKLVLVDPERVEAANLGRTEFEVRDVGIEKVRALARRLLNVSPSLSVQPIAQNLLDLGTEGVDQLVQSCDLVVAATDDPAAQRVLSRFSYARGKPAFFVALYAGARGGEVIVTVPGKTPCFSCSTGHRRSPGSAAGEDGSMDYGTGRLRGEVALGVDIHHVASAAVKLALSLLLPEEGEAGLSSFTREALAGAGSYLTLSTVAGYGFFPMLFEGTPSQWAFQSVWMTPCRRPACPACGSEEFREDPADFDLRLTGPISGPDDALLSGAAPQGVPPEGGETT